MCIIKYDTMEFDVKSITPLDYEEALSLTKDKPFVEVTDDKLDMIMYHMLETDDIILCNTDNMVCVLLETLGIIRR